LRQSIPNNYILKEQNISYKIKSAQKKDSSIIINLQITMVPSYDIDEKNLTGLIKGKPVSVIPHVIKNESGLTGYELVFDKKIPLLSFIVPFFEKNITIQTKPK
jgi:hypothetical protein